MELIRETAPYVLPLVFTALAAVIGSALVTPARLRRELAADVELFDHLPESEREDLRQEVARRARMLIAMTRYPVLKLSDLLAVLGYAGVISFVSIGFLLPLAQDDPVLVDPGVLSMPAFVAASCCWAFYLPWGSRAKARLEHIRDHLGVIEATDAARSVRVAYMVVILAGPGGIVTLQVVLGRMVYAVDGSFWTIGLASFGAISSVLILYFVGRVVRLSDTLFELDEGMQERKRAIVEHAAKRGSRRRAASEPGDAEG